MNFLNILPYKDMYFLQMDLCCIVLLLFLLIKWAKQKKDISTGSTLIRLTIAASVIFCASDAIAGVLEDYVFQGSTIIIYVANIIYYASVLLIAVFWMYYSLLKIGSNLISRKSKNWLLLIPAILFIVVLFSTPFTGWIFAIDPETSKYSRGPLVFLHWIATLFYVIYGVAIIVQAISKERNKVKKAELRSLLWFPIPPILVLIIQIFLEGVSIVQFGLTFSILLLYVEEQSSMVQTDDLTKLNNRRSLDIFIETSLNHVSSAIDFTFLMIDINHFKEINDNYGHLVGDQVLKSFAEILKASCEESQKRLFLCRYGGDEFLIVGKNVKDEDVETIKEYIANNMQEKIVLEDFDFNVSASIGVARGTCQDFEDVEHLIRVADEDMYEEKKKSRNKEIRKIK